MKYRFSKRKRLLCFFIGLATSGTGVAFSTAPRLGATPISSLPYTLSFIIPLSLGAWTVIFNILLILLQIAILKKDFHWRQLSQLLAVCVFGFFIDLGMYIAQLYIPENYLLRIVEQLFGCFLLAAGIVCELIADVTFVPGDGAVKVISQHWNLNLGKVKMGFDLSSVFLAVVVSFFCLGNIRGVREGTVLSAFLVGFLIKQLRAPSRVLKRYLVKS